MEKLNLAIIGHGFVGKAVDYAFDTPDVNVYVIDKKYPESSIETLSNLPIDITFVCVSTPMGADGEVDSSNVREVIEYLTNHVSGIIALKSTVTPDVVKWASELTDQFVYNPEFLTERNALDDFVNAEFNIVGAKSNEVAAQVFEIYEDFSKCSMSSERVHVSPVEASLIKYGINSFLASKVVWFNQFYDLVKASGCDVEEVLYGVTRDNRIGTSHSLVPGFDGKRGYAGACFPKDTIALARYAQSLGNSFSILEEVIERNQEYRKPYELDEREREQNVSYDHVV